MKKKLSRILGVGLTAALLASLLMMAAPVSALTQPSVNLLDDDISAVTDYTIMFNITEDLVSDSYLGTGSPDNIIVEFPTDTDLSGVTAVTIAATSGIGTDAFDVAHAVFSDDDETLTITIEDVDNDAEIVGDIGTGALVQVIVSGVKNLDTPGDYTLDVSTEESDGTEIEGPVTSASYELAVIDPFALGGIVQLFNAGGYFIDQDVGAGAIQSMIDAAQEDFVVKIGPGTYTDDIIIDDTTNDRDGLTLEATGSAADTIIEGDIEIEEDDITLDGLTIVGGYTGVAPWPTGTYITGADVTIKNSVFEKGDDDTPEILLIYSGWTDDDDSVIEDSTFDTTEGSEEDVGIGIDSGGLTISGSTFLVDENDIAIGADGDVTIEDNTFTGSSGIGVAIDDGDATIEGNTFDGLANAIVVDVSYDTVTIADNTIMNSTEESSDPDYWAYGPLDGVISIQYAYDSDVLIYNNDIMDSHEDVFVLVVEEYGDGVFMVFNNITGNELNVYNDSGDAINVTHNWWGDADGPPSDSIDEDAGDINHSPALGAPVTAAKVEASQDYDEEPSSLDAKTDVGVTVDVDDDAEVIAAAVYESNPKTSPPDPALGSFLDVYVKEDNEDYPLEEVGIKIYNDDVTEDTKAYVWSELEGKWVEASEQGVSTFGGYVWITITDATAPAIEDLSGIPIVLVEAPPSDLDSPEIESPIIGATAVALAPAFAWTIDEGNASEFQLADNSNFVIPITSMTGGGSLISTFYTPVTELDYDTVYFWRVRAVDIDEKFVISNESAWVASVFTTMSEPVEPVEPADIILEPADIIVEVEPPDIIVTLPPEAPITPGWIYVIIGIGAVLVISLIVLIVRTRRVA